MKVTGKNPRMFIGDKEIEGISSFSISGFDDIVKELPLETLTFTGTFDPIGKDEMEEHFKALQAKVGNIITANIYNYDGKFREARVRISYKDGQITLEPIDEEIKEWIKEWTGWKI
jgi:hypothetical protein